LNLPILTSAQMRAAEQAAFARGVQVEALMDQAGAGVAQTVAKFFANPGKCIVFAGKGHNAGDALVAAEVLRRRGWKIEVRLAFKQEDCSQLMRKKLENLRRRPPEILGAASASGPGDLSITFVELSAEVAGQLSTAQEAIAAETYRGTAAPLIILDGLLGVGARPPLREPIHTACRSINQLRSKNGAYVFAVDLPTGLDGDSGKADRDCVIADFTVTIGFAKAGLIADDALNYVGRLEVVPLHELHGPDKKAKEIIAGPPAFRGLLPRREYGAYKNQFGRIGVVAGSKGFIGAALMTSQGALRAGAGLVEVFVPEEIYEIVAGAAPMEAMVKPVQSYRDLLKEKTDVLALGPGLGTSRAGEVLELIEKAKQLMVVDADALNIISERPETLSRLAGPRLLTPHPGEMSRLFHTNNLSRADIVQRFTNEYPITLLLKGARTLIGQRGYSLSYNSTGTPGMATGGSGDLLTGVCGALLGRRIAPYDAARLAAWLCGRAAELTLGDESEESMIPTDTLRYFGKAFEEILEARS